MKSEVKEPSFVDATQQEMDEIKVCSDMVYEYFLKRQKKKRYSAQELKYVDGTLFEIIRNTTKGNEENEFKMLWAVGCYMVQYFTHHYPDMKIVMDEHNLPWLENDKMTVSTFWKVKKRYFNGKEDSLLTLVKVVEMWNEYSMK